MRHKRKWLVPLVCLSLCVPPLAAGTTGQLSGRVADEDGRPLAGVSISASSPSQIGGVLSTRTDSTGSFKYPRLSPGY